MNFITTMCVAVFAYYLLYLFTIAVAPKKRKEIETRNEKLDKMRTVAMKTLEQQKAFISTKFPKTTKTDWGKILTNVILFIVTFSILRFMFVSLGLNFVWWEGLLIIITVILGIHFILRPYGLQNSDIEVLLKW